VPLGRNCARPSHTARARPTATRGAARVGLGRRSARSPARPARATRGAWRERARDAHGGAARRANDDTTPAHGRRPRRRAAHRRGDGSAARRRRASGEAAGAARRRSGRRGFGPRWSGRALSGRRRKGRDGGRAAGVRGETALSGRRRAVPTALLTRGSCVAHGSHTATTCYHVGPARRAASDRWDPLIRVFCELKFTLDGNSSK
jgi:hypothetical protein